MAKLEKICPGTLCRRKGRIGLGAKQHGDLWFCSKHCLEVFKATEVREPKPISGLVASILKMLAEHFARHEPVNPKPSYRS